MLFSGPEPDPPFLESKTHNQKLQVLTEEFILYPNRVLISAILTQMAWLGIFSSAIIPNSYAAP